MDTRNIFMQEDRNGRCGLHMRCREFTRAMYRGIVSNMKRKHDNLSVSGPRGIAAYTVLEATMCDVAVNMMYPIYTAQEHCTPYCCVLASTFEACPCPDVKPYDRQPSPLVNDMQTITYKVVASRRSKFYWQAQQILLAECTVTYII